MIANTNSDIQGTIASASTLLGFYRELKGEFGGYFEWKKQVNRLLGDLGE